MHNCARLVIHMLRGLHGCSHYCTLLARSMVRVYGSSRESLTKNSVYSQSVTGCKSRVGERIYTASHKPNIIVVDAVVVSCWSCTTLNLVFWWFITFMTFQRVQSSPVQSSPFQ